MKRYVLAVLVAFIVAHAPWRLALLTATMLGVTPGLTHVTKDDSHYWQALNLERRLNELGWQVNYVRDLNIHDRVVYGMTFRDDRVIYVEEGLHWTARHAVLAHEGGHALQPGWLTADQGEVFAEAVATLVTRNGYREHARYLSSYKYDYLLVVVLEWRRIYRAAAWLESP